MAEDSKYKLEQELGAIEATMADPSFWQNKAGAQETVRRYNELKEELASGGTGNKYDRGDAIVTIFSGAGGDDAEDFSRMLFDMYQKYCERVGYTTHLLHENQNDHRGFRNVTFEISGASRSQASKGSGSLTSVATAGAYGILKNESGVHRLVRVSPFNAKGLRHTSFSLVEVIPKLPKTTSEAIPSEEIRIEFMRAGGPGGQNVNKRESAVRVVHIPTGLSAHASNERSQASNRERALEILTGKLFKLREEQRKKKEQGMYISKTTEIEWGNQIRSYVLHPYKLVKDHRTNMETSKVDKVLNGELDEFIEAESKL